MKQLLSLLGVGLITSCSISGSDSKIIGKDTLKNNTVIQLEMRGGGATAPDVIWVKKVTDTEENYVGKIKWYLNGFESKISQVNDSIIKVRLTDTVTIWKGQLRDFTISLNNRVNF
jgi:hypothetical protein